MSDHAPDFLLHRGDAALIISLPHDGTAIPEDLHAVYVPEALAVPDTDWHVGRLYEFARGLGATILSAHWSRYVVDLNRPPDGQALYPGRSETGLCPLISFEGAPLYFPGQQPDEQEIRRRVARYWRPYHQTLRSELERLRELHANVLLWEGHSIRGEVPMFFSGRLPDLNLGTADGTSCAADLQSRLQEALEVHAGDYSWTVNGRFKGGYITRHFGAPAEGSHAVQMELVQDCYMQESPPWTWSEHKARPLQAVLDKLLRAGLDQIS